MLIIPGAITTVIDIPLATTPGDGVLAGVTAGIIGAMDTDLIITPIIVVTTIHTGIIVM